MPGVSAVPQGSCGAISRDLGYPATAPPPHSNPVCSARRSSRMHEMASVRTDLTEGPLMEAQPDRATVEAAVEARALRVETTSGEPIVADASLRLAPGEALG